MHLVQRNHRFWVNALLVCLLFSALGVRLYRIQAQSLWNDEGTSVALAARDLAAITRGAANDIHPPLYYYLLHFWMACFGNSELAVRSLSAVLGTMLVLMTFVFGRLLSGNAAGLIAALFAALSPFQVYYSQETRMYALSAFLGALSMYAFVRLLSAWQGGTAHSDADVAPLGRLLPAGLYVATTGLLLYSHYFGAALLVVQNMSFLWWLVVARKVHGRFEPASGVRLLLRWGMLQAAVATLYSPWLLQVLNQLRAWPAISEPLGATSLALDLLRVFSLGLSVEPRFGTGLLAFAMLLLLGLLPLRATLSEEGRGCTASRTRGGKARTTNPIAYVVCLLYLLVPAGLMYVLSLRRPMYNPKFLLLCIPPFDVFLALGALLPARIGCWQAERSASGRLRKANPRTWCWAGTVLSLAAIVFVISSSLASLQAYYFNPRYARDDYRGIAQYIQALERSDDSVLINAPGQVDTFAYYYRGHSPVYPLPRQRPLDVAQTEADLRQIIQGRKRVFAVLWATDESDPARTIEGWLDQNTYKAQDSWYGNVRLVVYAVPAKVAEGIEHPLNVNLGHKVRLIGYNLPVAEVMPGDILQLTVFWQAVAPMTERYKVFTHIIDARGHLVGQRDAEPGGGAKITTIWKENERVIDNYGLPILAGTPPGDYAVEIGLYGLDNGARLQVIEGSQSVADHVVLQSVRVLPAAIPPPLAVLAMKKQFNVRFGDVTLLGYNLTKLGYEHDPDAPIHPGDVLHLTLFWQADREPDHDVVLLLQLQDEKGSVKLERREQPTEGQYPAQQWSVSEIVRDQHNLPLPGNLAPGRYRLQLTVEYPGTGQQIGQPLILADLTLR